MNTPISDKHKFVIHGAYDRETEVVPYSVAKEIELSAGKEWMPFDTVPINTFVLVYEKGGMYKTSFSDEGLIWLKSKVKDGIVLPSHWMHTPPEPIQ
jgi:hypothetical protein